MTDLAAESWFREAALQRVLSLLNREGGEGRVVGGAVRNSLMGLPVSDIDIATTLSPEAVMAREARPGKTVIVYDEGGNWKGAGTAWKLAEDGHTVILVTPAAMVGSELQRTAADFPLRRRLAGLGVRFITESGILKWTGKAANVTSFLNGGEQWIEADALVMSTTNRANDEEHRALEAMGFAAKLIGDAAAPRPAPYAIHEGRKAALGIK